MALQRFKMDKTFMRFDVRREKSEKRAQKDRERRKSEFDLKLK